MTQTFAPTYPIHTERLILRPYEAGDLDDLYAMHAREDVVRFLYWDVRTREETATMLERRMTRTAITNEGDAIILAVVLPETGNVIGDVMLSLTSAEHQQGEIGFIFHPDFHGKGYAGEAAQVVLRMGFEDLKLHRIVGRCEGKNTSSAKLLGRLGMRQEAHLRENEFVKGHWDDELIFAMLNREWIEISCSGETVKIT